MRYSGIGGQAVLEGVMMRNRNKYAVAVRKQNKEIEVKVSDFNSLSDKFSFLKLPLLRGVVNFMESLFIGMKALSFSSDLFEENDVTTAKKKKNEGNDGIATAMVVAFSILMAIAVFMILPYGLSLLFQRWINSHLLLTALEGVIRLCILILYMVGIAYMPDIKRVYMYHGAEHKAINCVEEGLPLTVSNVKKMTRKHLRCGTGFVINVIILSIILFMFIRVENVILRLVFRIVLVPVIAAFAYEFLRLAGTTEYPIVKFLSIPGLWFQSLTTKEPDDKMIEVAIASIEAVFDWKAFLNLEDEASCCKKEGSVKKRKKGKGHKTGKDEIQSDRSHCEIQKEKLLNEKKNDKISASVIEEDNDEILNALDKFFNSHRAEKNKSGEKNVK